MVVAKEACVVVVGAKAGKYHRREVVDRHTGAKVEIDMTDPAWGWEEDPVEGTSYVFKPLQRVPRSHPAVKTSPGSFMDLDDLDDAELELVSS
jgi:hypothetical protein